VILFYNKKLIIYDKIDTGDIFTIVSKLQFGVMVYEEFNNIRISMHKKNLQIVNLRFTSPTEGLDCQVVEFPVRTDIGKTFRDVVGTILKNETFNLTALFSALYLKVHGIDTVKSQKIAGNDIFNPVKRDIYDFPKIDGEVLNNKLLAYYIINSEDLSISCFENKDPENFIESLSNYGRLSLAYDLHSTESLISDKSTNIVTDEGFDITFSLPAEYYFLGYNMVYDKNKRFKEIINSIKNCEVSVESLTKEDLVPMVVSAIIRSNPYNIEKLPLIQLTDEDYSLAVSLDGGVLALIPEDRKTLDICNVAMENEPYAKEFIPESLKGKFAI